MSSVFNEMGLFRFICCYVYYAIMWLKGFRTTTFEETIQKLNTTMKVLSWLVVNIRYKSDIKPEDEWLSPREVFKRREDDCEGWARFATECLHDKYEVFILCMYTEESGHATCLIKIGDDEWRSVGTFGGMVHHGEIKDIIKNWKGFENWESYNLKSWDAKKNITYVENARNSVIWRD